MNLKTSLSEIIYKQILQSDMSDLQKICLKLFLTLFLSPFLHKKKLFYHFIVTSLVYLFIYSLHDLLILFLLYFINISYYFKMKESIFKMYFLIFFNFGVLILGAYFFKEKGNPTSIGCELILLPPKIHFLYQYDKMDLKSVTGYFFFLPTLPGGPAVRLTGLKKYVTFDKNVLVYKAIKICVFYFIFSYENFFKKMPKELSNKILSFFYNLIFFQLFCICYRFKYYLIWEISSLSYYLTGLSLSNINCLKVELASSLREVSWEWNRWGGIWLKECFFDRIDNPFLGGMITFLMGSFWHGAHLHDFSFFITYCFSMQLINYFHSFLPANLFFNIFSKIETNLLISYVPIHFYYGNIKEGNSMLKKIYFYGHVYFFIIFMIFLYEKMFLRSVKKIKKNHSFKKI